MEFNTHRGGAAGYLSAAQLAPGMNYGGTFDPVKQIGQARQNASFMARKGEEATGEILLGGIIGDEIRQVEKYKADLAKAGAMAEAQQTTNNAMLGLGRDILGGVSSFIPSGGGMDPVGSQGNPFGNVGSDSPIYGIPGGAAVGGGRVPLNG